VRFAAVRVGGCPVYRYQVQIAVAHTALGDDGLCKSVHRLHRSLQHDRFQAVVVVDVDMLGGKRQFMVRVLGLHEPPCQVEFVVIVDIGQGSHAVPGFLGFQLFLSQSDPDQVAHCFGTIGVTVGLDIPVELLRQALFEGYGEALAHGPTGFDGDTRIIYQPQPGHYRSVRRKATGTCLQSSTAAVPSRAGTKRHARTAATAAWSMTS